MRAMGPGAEAVGVEDDLWGGHYGLMLCDCVGVEVREGSYIEQDTPL